MSGDRVRLWLARVTSIIVVLTWLVPAPATAQGETQAGNPMVFGIASHAWWLDPEVYGDQLFPALDDLNVTTVRIGIDWKRFEPSPGQFDWSLYDRVLGELAKRNIVVVANFNTIPDWASVDQIGCSIDDQEIHTCQLREDMYGAYENAVRAAISRYAWIENWEFWNEPEMWKYLGADAGAYVRYLRTFYDIAHSINPEVTVAASTLVGQEYMSWAYDISEARYGDGNEPWDAISIHPYVWNYTPEEYGRPLEINYDRILGLRAEQVARGDADEKIWITEYGWDNGVENQARNLRAALDWMKQQTFIGFAHLHMLHDWNDAPIDSFGLMEIVPDEQGRRVLNEDTEFRPKPVFYNAFRDYPRDGLPLPPQGEGVACFAETGQCITGRFLRGWEQRGGVRIMGLPLTRPYPRLQSDGRWLLVQDFERARLEFHPEYLGGWGEVLGRLVGSEITEDRRQEEPFRPIASCVDDDDRDCFAETSHSIGGTFRDFWRNNGGLAAFGYPISQEFKERNQDTGEIYTVQYFERARFEYHPEYEGTPYVVLLGRIIANELESDGWASPPVGSRLPTARSYGHRR